MDNGGLPGVEVVQPLQDLAAPGTDKLDLDILEPTHVPAGGGWRQSAHEHMTSVYTSHMPQK